MDYAQQRRRNGATIRQVADETGVRWKTMERWLARGGRGERDMSLLPVEIVEEPADAAAGSIVVRGPGGVVVEGLDVGQLAELLQRLG